VDHRIARGLRVAAIEEIVDGEGRATALQFAFVDGDFLVCTAQADGSLLIEKRSEPGSSVRTLVPDMPVAGLEVTSTGEFMGDTVFMTGGHRVTVRSLDGQIETVVTDRGGDWEDFDRINAENERKTREKLAAAKAEAAERGKEPFDVVQMLALYEPYDQYRYPAPLDELGRYHERSYYLTSPEIMTLAEYADYLRRADMG
jgi:hypothetical protein